MIINKKFVFYCSCFACWFDREMKGFIAGDKFQELLETTNALLTLGSTKHVYVKSFPCGRSPSDPSEIVPIPRRIKILFQFPSKSARCNWCMASIYTWKCFKILRNTVLQIRCRIQTGFHRFTKIGQIFHEYWIYIFNEKKKVLSKLKSGKYPVWISQKPRKRDFW